MTGATPTRSQSDKFSKVLYSSGDFTLHPHVFCRVLDVKLHLKLGMMMFMLKNDSKLLLGTLSLFTIVESCTRPTF
ncbi:hypothetical protein QVD17_34486 [Tagetes erecta]|uniref:Uncharacterized protein n=1 Tax=Tagetes erecta TaxID=13708 RepID=A0AAD8JZY7_TARER|nr:hypothetical protein QVD17_34486 [Tagetes erecta]